MTSTPSVFLPLLAYLSHVSSTKLGYLGLHCTLGEDSVILAWHHGLTGMACQLQNECTLLCSVQPTEHSSFARQGGAMPWPCGHVLHQ